MLVFTGVYVCVKAKVTLVSFFFLVFFAPFPYLLVFPARNVYKRHQLIEGVVKVFKEETEALELLTMLRSFITCFDYPLCVIINEILKTEIDHAHVAQLDNASDGDHHEPL